MLAKIRATLVDVLDGGREKPCLLGQPCPAIHIFVQLVNVLSEDDSVRELSAQLMEVEVSPRGSGSPRKAPFSHSPVVVVVVECIAPEVLEKAKVAAAEEAKATREAASVLEEAKRETNPVAGNLAKVLPPKEDGPKPAKRRQAALAPSKEIKQTAHPEGSTSGEYRENPMVLSEGSGNREGGGL